MCISALELALTTGVEPVAFPSTGECSTVELSKRITNCEAIRAAHWAGLCRCSLQRLARVLVTLEDALVPLPGYSDTVCVW